jgi:hypothetical protein
MKSGAVETYSIIDGRTAKRYWVHDRILVGGEITSPADARQLVDAHGITHSLSLQWEKSDDELPDNVLRAQFGHPDAPPEPFTREKLQKIVAWASAALDDKRTVLYVHCQLGSFRSPAIAWLLLRAVFGFSAQEAQNLVQAGYGSPIDMRPCYVDSINAFLLTYKSPGEVAVFGTISDDGLNVWDGQAWVSHGLNQFPLDKKDKWPRKLMKLRNGQWFPYTKLFISTPTYNGTAYATYMASLLQLSRGCTEMGIEVRLSWPRGDGIARCRIRQISEFLDTDCTHYCAVDADIGFNPQHLLDMVTSNLDLVFGAYPAKGIEWGQIWDQIKAGVITDPSQMEKAGLRFVVNYDPKHCERNEFPTVQLPGGQIFLEVREASTGFTVIKRSVIEHMIESYPELTYLDDYPTTRFKHQFNLFCMGIDPDAPHEVAVKALREAALAATTPGADAPTSMLEDAAQKYRAAFDSLKTDAGLGRYLSEDYGFCRLAAKIGYKIYVYAQAHLSHTGLYTYEGAYRDSFTQNKSPETDNGQAQQAPVV